MRLLGAALVAFALVGAVIVYNHESTPPSARQENAKLATFFDGFCQSGAAYRRCSGAVITLDSGETGKITGWTTSRGKVKEIRIKFNDLQFPYQHPLDLTRADFSRIQKVVAEVATDGRTLEYMTYTDN